MEERLAPNPYIGFQGPHWSDIYRPDSALTSAALAAAAPQLMLEVERLKRELQACLAK
jgi:hypothetical protein